MSEAPGRQGNRVGWQRSQTAADRVADAAIRAFLWLALRLPYDRRVALSGWLMRKLGAVQGAEQRAVENIRLVWPELDRSQARAIARGSLDNFGRTFIENFSTEEFLARAATTRLTGAGLEALRAARAAGRPAILATGHFGNYEAPRAALCALGWQVGGIYRPMNNAFFNAHYVKTMTAFGGPVVPRGTAGTRALMKAVRQGGFMVILFDQYMREGVELPFLGRPSLTMTSPADIALKYDAVLVPFFGIRNPDGLTFTAQFDAPVPHGDPLAMTRALNDALTARIEAHPEQWLWVHRRWKVRRQRTRRTANTSPGPSA